MSEPLWAEDAVAVVKLLHSGEIAAQELLDATEERVKAVNPVVNALPTLCFERGRQRIASHRDLADTLLGGLPVPIKDSYPVEGVRTTFGSRVYEHNIPSRSDFLVESVEAAGGIVFAKSNTPEFEAGANTFNDVFGATLNPWDTRLSAAGSSGGAAVAVATGMAAIAQGSDFACSLRYPAAFCGVVGLRPSPGIVPQGPGGVPGQTLSVIGPLARNVADVGLGLQAMARFDMRDPLSRPMKQTNFAAAATRPEKPLRLAFGADLGVADLDDEVRDVVVRAMHKLAAAGGDVVEACPDLSAADAAFRTLRAHQFAAARGELLRGPERDMLKPEVIWNIEHGLGLSSADISAAVREQARARASLVAFLDDHEFLLSATAPVAPFPVEERYVSRIAGRELPTYLDWLILGYAVTVTGCPAISIPCGFTSAGLPVGLQIVARPYAEASLLSVAAWCEGVLDCRMRRPIDPKVFSGDLV
ncbi:MAG: amidase [Mesorhizobium sp.]|nr:amidase family protein [Mesorhizobium sp.]MBL8576369.1 amidase [Mesorhizobium sp.]